MICVKQNFRRNSCLKLECFRYAIRCTYIYARSCLPMFEILPLRKYLKKKLSLELK